MRRTPSRRMRALVACIAIVPLAAACTDRALTTLPDRLRPLPENAALTTCSVTVATGSMTCTSEPNALRSLSPDGSRDGRIIGGQDIYVKLTQTSFTYDAGPQVLTSNISVQNLTQTTLGVAGDRQPGVMVFFHVDPTVTDGTGSVSIDNADGADMFIAPNQPYFLYAEELEPLEISQPKPWQFTFSGVVNSFTFQVYVAANKTDESGTVATNTWKGTESTDWFDPDNWSFGAVPNGGLVSPDTMITANIPVSSTTPLANLPVLTADAHAGYVRVGTGSTLNLGGYTLQATGSVDATGSIVNGTLHVAGSGVLLGGTVDAVLLTGSAKLQRPILATGAMAITEGTLAVSDQTLTISIP